MARAHCWTGKRTWIEETYGWGSPEFAATFLDDYKDATCMLWEHHEGEHDFTPDSAIGVTFVGDPPW